MKNRQSFEKEIADIDAAVDSDLEAMKKIFRELWDIRVANESIARTMESQNV